MGLFSKTEAPSGEGKQAAQDHRMRLGLGDMIRRLVVLDAKYRQGICSATDLAERELIFSGLNEIQVPVTASCTPGEDLNQNGIPDTTEFFRIAAATDCCVLQHKPEARQEKPKKRGRL